MKKNHAKVFHLDLYGKRENKYDFLINNNIKSINWNELNPNEPYYFFVPKNDEGRGGYENGIKLSELFIMNNVGCVSAHDGLNFSYTKNEQIVKLNELLKLDEQTWRLKYKRPKDAQSWKYIWAKEDAHQNINNELVKISYRPFDNRWSLYTGKSGGLYARPSSSVMQHFLKGNNVGLVFRRQQPDSRDLYIFCTTNIIADGLIRSDNKGGESTAPLYLYPDDKGQQEIGQDTKRKPNLNMEIVGKIAESLGQAFVAEKNNSPSTEGVAASADGVVSYSSFAPIDILDYIYAVLHSPTYREKYKEFLKIDFPRVPYPKDADTFWELVKLGGGIRQIHLLESPIVEKYITKYPIDGNNVVEKIKFENGRVYINSTQYFDNVPEIAWNFYIGGYQPAQKWLKDRKERKLEFEDILHYQKIIVALTETDRLMKEIDKIEIE